MNRSLVGVFALSLLFMSHGRLAAQGIDDPVDGPPVLGLRSLVEKYKIEIRKSFDGTKNEQTPASLTYVDSDAKGSFYAIDFAVRAKGWGNLDTAPEGKRLWGIFPSAELHRSTESAKPIHKRSLAVNLEMFTNSPLRFDSSGKQLEDEDQAPGARRFAGLLFGKLKVERDSEKDETTNIATLAASLFGTKRFDPGKITPHPESFHPWVRYYPYVGLEYYDNKPIENDDQVIAAPFSDWFAFGRIYGEWYPTVRWGPAGLQVIAEITLRALLSDDPELDDVLDHVTVAVNYYFDSEQRFAMGVELEDGQGPQRNFLDERTISIAMRFKL